MKLIEALQKKFTDLSITEHFQSFYRFKIASDISIGKVFGFFEERKTEMKIVQYSVKQTSIEQIFNAFANNALPVKGKNWQEIKKSEDIKSSEEIPEEKKEP